MSDEQPDSIEAENFPLPPTSLPANRAEDAPARKIRRARPAGPALTITIQSWATPIVGIAMLIAGLLLGYFGRPLLADASAGAQAGGSAGQGAVLIPTADPAAAAAANPDLMEFLIGQTRHFKGSPDAPVTLIEFSDFQ